MTQFEMAEKISERCNVSLEDARNALEAGGWNPLTAAQQIEVDKVRRMQELDAVASGCAAAVARAEADEAEAQTVAGEAASQARSEAREAAEAGAGVKGAKREKGQGLRNVGEHVRRLVACGNRNRLVVQRGGETMLELPVTVLALFMLFAFWVCVPLLAVGLFAGCRYSFNGKELGRESVNGALDKAANAAEHVKKAVAQA